MSENSDPATTGSTSVNSVEGLPLDMIHSCLCAKDKRNPLWTEVYAGDVVNDDPLPRVNCFCDNCFYGRDRLAVEILRLRELNNRLANVRCKIFIEQEEISDAVRHVMGNAERHPTPEEFKEIRDRVRAVKDARAKIS